MVPTLHEQWRGLDFRRLLSRQVAFVSIDAQNSILDPEGCLRHENLWRGAKEPGGSFHNAMRLAAACRAVEAPFVWMRYDRFIGEKEPGNEMDRVQYRFWNQDYPGDRARKDWECALVPEAMAVHREGDMNLVYPAWSIFTGTGLERWLNQWGVRTILLTGYHTDWCVEMATRHARELGYLPIVVGDACGTTQPLHDQTLAQINGCYAPVVTTDEIISHLQAFSPMSSAAA